MCEDENIKLRSEEPEVVTQRLLCLQKAILSNESLMAGLGTKHRFAPSNMALDVYTMSKYLYEHSISFAKKQN